MKTDRFKPHYITEGQRYGIRTCCFLFFATYHYELRRFEPEYNDQYVLCNNEGIVLCPDCLVERLNG